MSVIFYIWLLIYLLQTTGILKRIFYYFKFRNKRVLLVNLRYYIWDNGQIEWMNRASFLPEQRKQLRESPVNKAMIIEDLHSEMEDSNLPEKYRWFMALEKNGEESGSYRTWAGDSFNTFFVPKENVFSQCLMRYSFWGGGFVLV